MSKIAQTLEEQIKKQQEKLAQLKARKQAIDARVKTLESKKSRASDTRKKVLIGAAILAKNGNNPEAQEQTRLMMDKFLTRDNERKLFGFAPIPPATDKPVD